MRAKEGGQRILARRSGEEVGLRPHKEIGVILKLRERMDALCGVRCEAILWRPRAGLHGCIHDGPVPRAPAQVARQGVLQGRRRQGKGRPGPGPTACGRLGGARRPPQEGVHAHHKARRTEAALGAVCVGQGGLDRVQAVPHAAQALHRHHVAPLRGGEGHEARVDGAVVDCWMREGRAGRGRPAVAAADVVQAGEGVLPGGAGVSGAQHDGAGAAPALAAAQLGAGEGEVWEEGEGGRERGRGRWG